MSAKFTILLCVACAALCATIISATEVKQCNNNEPFPLAVRVEGCDVPPCTLIRGTNVVFEIDFVSYKYITHMTTKAKAHTLGFSVNYELPENVRNVCANLMYGAYCPLYATEDVTYLFVFPIGNYPEVGVRVEISLYDQDDEVTTCFQCDIKVKKGNTGGGNETQILDGNV